MSQIWHNSLKIKESLTKLNEIELIGMKNHTSSIKFT